MADEAETVVVGLRIERALLPDWFEAVQQVAAPLMKRMAVMEKPDEWLLRVELETGDVDAFHAGLASAWAAFAAKRREDGTWEEEE